MVALPQLNCGRAPFTTAYTISSILDLLVNAVVITKYYYFFLKFSCFFVLLCVFFVISHVSFKGTDHVGTFMGLKCVVYYANYRSGNQSSKIQVVP